MSDPINTPPLFPRRASLAAEVADHLRACLQRLEWQQWMPGEMELARQLQVGRNSIRSALLLLQNEGLLKASKGRRRMITEQAHLAAPGSGRLAVILLSTPLSALPQPILLWIFSLRERILRMGWDYEIVVEPTVYQRAPDQALETLFARYPTAVWVLHYSTAAMQSWFQARKVKAIVAGSNHKGISLPFVDFDYRATARHAAGRFIALGHRKLALLKSQKNLAGDTESLIGFHEGADGVDVALGVVKNDTVPATITALKELFKSHPDLSGLFILRADHFATALTHLLQQRFSIPSQVSLICRDHDFFLQHLQPEPTRYQGNPESMAKILARLIKAYGEGILPTKCAHLLVPSFARGETLGRINAAQGLKSR